MKNKVLFKDWNIKYFILLLFSAVLYIKLWCEFELTASLFDKMDYGVFYYLNNLLHNDTWSLFCAIINTRYFDLFSASCMILVALLFIFKSKRYCIVRRISLFAIVCLFMGISSYASQYLFLGVERISPTREHLGGSKYMRRRIIKKMKKQGRKMDVIFLGRKHLNIDTKDGSNLTFPSDHGVVLGAFIVGMLFYGGMKLGLLSFALGVIFSIPRLLSGAHFITDTLVGTVVVIMLSTAFFYMTPLHLYFEKYSRLMAHKLINKKLLYFLRKIKKGRLT